MAFDPILRNANPATDMAPIVVGTPYGLVARGIYVGVGGNMTVTTPQGNNVVLTGVLPGTVYWVESTGVTAATATNLVALF